MQLKVTNQNDKEKLELQEANKLFIILLRSCLTALYSSLNLTLPRYKHFKHN